jgi:Antitoxin VbhA
MAVETAPVRRLTPADLYDRRLAVENTIGTMRIEGLDPDETTLQILARYADGQIEFSEAKRLLREYSRTIL